jgi:hypothetical protein
VFAQLHAREDDSAFRAWLADALGTFADRRAERYWQLIAALRAA